MRQTFFILLTFLIPFVYSSVACCTTDMCYSNERCFAYNNAVYCCNKASCRLFKGKLPDDDSTCLNPGTTGINTLENVECGEDGINCLLTNPIPNIFHPVYNIPFVCYGREDCQYLTDEPSNILGYCCHSQFCWFNETECRPEDINFKLSEGLVNAMVGISVALFAINLGVAIMLIYKLKSQTVRITKETSSVKRIEGSNFDFYDPNDQSVIMNNNE